MSKRKSQVLTAALFGLVLSGALVMLPSTQVLAQQGAPTLRPAQGGGGTQDAGEAVVVEATGMGAFRIDDPQRSRDEAMEAAQREAVEKASGVIISSESMMKNFELVSDEVLSRSKGFIRKYDVLKEGSDGQIFTIVIRAEVVKQAFLSNINESLEELYQRVGKPRVMLTVEEMDIGTLREAQTTAGAAGAGIQPEAMPSLQVVEKEIRKILLKQGFTFIDARAVKKGSIVESAEKGRDTSRVGLLDQARTSKAELLMIGRGQIGGRAMLNKFHVVDVSVGLDVVRTDNGQVMASEVVSSKGLNINQDAAAVAGLQKASQEITPKIMEQVTYLWLSERQQGSRVELVVKNISFKDLAALRKKLGTEVKGGKKVTQRSFSEGTALLEVVSRDRPERLAESLDALEVNGTVLSVEDVSANGVVLAGHKKG
ncbi:MAG: hypothetical protein OEW39_03070 [Deltaproteobacteria bacterium]|nr:hypothetical protein [Deltaproteobacteria bacterium]